MVLLLLLFDSSCLLKNKIIILSLVLLFFLICSTTVVHGRHILEGIHLPLEKEISIITKHDNDDNNNNVMMMMMKLNGAGVRSINMFGWEFKVYVASFYTSHSNLFRTEMDIFSILDNNNYNNDDDHSSDSDNNNNNNEMIMMQFDFSFLRAVNANRVKEAWTKQTEHSVDYIYPGYENDRNIFISCFGPLRNGGTETVQLFISNNNNENNDNDSNNKTIIIDQGIEKGIIYGRNFQRAFLSMWFGEKAVAIDLKEGLLGKISHFGLQQQQPHDDNTVSSISNTLLVEL